MDKIRRFEIHAACLMIAIVAFTIGFCSSFFVQSSSVVIASDQKAQDLTIEAPVAHSYIKEIHYKAYTENMDTYNEITSKGYIDYIGPNEVNVVHLTDIQEE